MNSVTISWKLRLFMKVFNFFGCKIIMSLNTVHRRTIMNLNTPKSPYSNTNSRLLAVFMPHAGPCSIGQTGTPSSAPTRRWGELTLLYLQIYKRRRYIHTHNIFMNYNNHRAEFTRQRLTQLAPCCAGWPPVWAPSCTWWVKVTK